MASGGQQPSSFSHPWDSFLKNIATDIQQQSASSPPLSLNKPHGTSYAQVLNGSSFTAKPTVATTVSNDDILPVKKGDYFSVVIQESLYQKQVRQCESSLIGRLVLSKGDKPWQMVDLRNQLQVIWAPSSPWKLISLGRGFYNIQFSSIVDRDKIWDKGSWAIKPGIMRLQKWVPDFNPYKIRTSVAQVWIRIYELSIEYWHPDILFGIARAVGTPIKIDNNTIHGGYGHYARILVEIDLSLPLQEQVMLERTGHCTFVSISFEFLPDFCSHCSMVGHSPSNCKRQLPKDTSSENKRSRSRSCEPKRSFKMDKGKYKMVTEPQGTNNTSGLPLAKDANPELLEGNLATQTIIPISNNFAALNIPDAATSQSLQALTTEGQHIEQVGGTTSAKGTNEQVPTNQDISVIERSTTNPKEQISVENSFEHMVQDSHLASPAIPSIQNNMAIVIYQPPSGGTSIVPIKETTCENSDNSLRPPTMLSPSTASVSQQPSRIDEAFKKFSNAQHIPFDPDSDILKQKIEEIRSSVINPPPILVASEDDNVAFKVMSIAARKSWADFAEEQDLQSSTVALEHSPDNPDTTAKDPIRKSTRNRRPAFKLRL